MAPGLGSNLLRWIPTLFFLLAISVQAGEPGLRPSPRPSSFSYDSAEAEFNSGRVPKPEEIHGEWIQTGMVKLAGFPDTSFPDSYLPSGLRNQDGSVRSLYFSLLTGPANYAVESVTFHNLGSRAAHQGPYSTALGPGGLSFGQWPGVGANGAAHFDYLCRLAGSARREMICEIAFYVDQAAAVTTRWLRYSGRIVYYASYVPQPLAACSPGTLPFPCEQSKREKQ